MIEDITTLKLRDNVQLLLQNHNGQLYMEFQVKYPSSYHFGDLCINCGCYDIITINNYLTEIDQNGIENFITKHEKEFI